MTIIHHNHSYKLNYKPGLRVKKDGNNNYSASSFSFKHTIQDTGKITEVHVHLYLAGCQTYLVITGRVFICSLISVILKRLPVEKQISCSLITDAMSMLRRLIGPMTAHWTDDGSLVRWLIGPTAH